MRYLNMNYIVGISDCLRNVTLMKMSDRETLANCEDKQINAKLFYIISSFITINAG